MPLSSWLRVKLASVCLFVSKSVYQSESQSAAIHSFLIQESIQSSSWELDETSFIFTRRLAKEAAKTIEDMRKATEKELNEAKQKLEKEKEDALKKLKEQYQKDQDNEEERLRKEHDAVMKTLGEKAREDALEEEAMLQEGKQDAMRKLKQQIQREQDEEEAALRKKKDEALDLIREALQVWAVFIQGHPTTVFCKYLFGEADIT